MSITISDIASQAGVSKATVSRVLNQSGYVHENTRYRIEEIIRRNNYMPSATARNLANKQTKTIGMIIPEADNAFFGEILKGVSQVAFQNNYALIFCDTQNNRLIEEKALLSLKEQRVVGLIYTPSSDYSEPVYRKRLKELLDALETQIVFLDRAIDHLTLDGVFFENRHSAYVATEALINAGNRRIGVITGNLDLQIGRERYQGFCQAMKAHDLPICPQYVYKGDFMLDTAYRITKEFLASGDYPEAVLTSNNRTTMGFVKAVNQAGLVIGQDIAAIGIDYVEALDLFSVNFSYIERNTLLMGQTVMHQLLERIKNPYKPHEICNIPFQVVLKGSERRG